VIGCSSSSTTPYEVTTSAAHVRVTVPMAGVFRVQLSRYITPPGTYLFTFWEPLDGAAAHYTIVKQ
jgi:hypothetical protein